MENEKKELEGGIWKVSEKRTVPPKEKKEFDWTKSKAFKAINTLEKRVGLAVESDGIGGTGKRNKSRGADDLLAQFEKFRDDKTAIDVKFDSHDNVGNFTVVTPEGVLFILPSENFLPAGKEFNKYQGSAMLGMKISVVPETVNREKLYVTFKRSYAPGVVSKEDRARADKFTYMKNLRDFFDDQERKGTNEMPLVLGRVDEVSKDFAYVDLLDAGIAATIGAKFWARGYVPDLRDFVHSGEYLEFYVREFKKEKKTGKNLFYLSRIGLEPDAWANVNFTGLKAGKDGSTIIVKCIDKPVNKNYFWGVSDRVHGIEITCEYTDKFRKGSYDVLEGIRYKCKVDKIEDGSSGKKPCFVVIPFDVVPEDRQKVANAKELKKGGAVRKEGSSAKEKVTEAPGGTDE